MLVKRCLLLSFTVQLWLWKCLYFHEMFFHFFFMFFSLLLTFFFLSFKFLKILRLMIKQVHFIDTLVILSILIKILFSFLLLLYKLFTKSHIQGSFAIIHFFCLLFIFLLMFFEFLLSLNFFLLNFSDPIFEWFFFFLFLLDFHSSFFC